MLWTIVVALLMFWALGLISSNLFGGAIHLALAVAVGLVVFRALQRRPRPPTADTRERRAHPRPSHPRPAHPA